MLDHHIQRTIVYRLAFSPGLRFGELKPDDIENKLFDYHLKKVVSAKLVLKQDDGTYALTPEGRLLGIHILDTQQAAIDRPKSILLLAVRRKSDKAWLLYRRKTHPLLGQIGFMHCAPLANLEAVETAAQACLDKTGIKATFRVLGSGYFKVYKGDDLESFTHFSFLISDDGEGDLVQNDEFAEFFWADDPDFTDEDMLPNTKTLGNLHKANELFFIDKTFKV